MNILVINGPNLNLLGTRQPEIYGDSTLADIESACRSWAAGLNAKADAYQSNHEGDIIDQLHRTTADAVIINPGALSHYSYAIRDAIEAIEIPTVEVHLSNIRAREPWRRHSVVADVCVTTIYGRGVNGYRDAIAHLASRAAWPMRTLSYGPDDAQVGDLRLPEVEGPHRVVILFHGGLWRDTAGRDQLDAVAVDLAQRGWASWNVAYRGSGSGAEWRTATSDAAAAFDALASFGPEHGLSLGHVISVGFEAGGQLAMGLAGPTAEPRRVHPAAVAGIAAVSDLEAAYEQNLGDGAIADYVGKSPKEAPDRYAALSPIALVPMGVPILVVHGDADDIVPVSMSRAFAGRAADSGEEVVYHELESVGNEDLYRPGTMAYERVADELDRLSRRIAATG